MGKIKFIFTSKGLVAFVLSLLLFFGVSVYSAKMYVSTGADWQNLKMLCPYEIPIKVDHSAWEWTNSTTLQVTFNTWELIVGYVVGSYLQQSATDAIEFSTSLYDVTTLVWYYVYGAESNPNRVTKTAYQNISTKYFTWTWVPIATIGISTYSVNTFSSSLGVFWNLWYNSRSKIINTGNIDILAETGGMTFYFYTWPCSLDVYDPYAISFSPTLNTSPTKVYSASWISFYLKDDTSDSPWSQPWYNNDNMILSDTYYKTGVAGKNLGIATWTISFTLRGDGWNYNGWVPLVFDASNVTILSWMTKTRDRFRRDYYVKISWDVIVDYGKERQMIFSWYFLDRAWNDGSFSYTFNSPVNPRLSNQSPSSWQMDINPHTDVSARISDDRAWVDSWSLWVFIKSWWCNWTLLYTFTWSQLNLSWVDWSADYPDYTINISSWSVDFPTPYINICVIVSGQDLAWNTITNNSWTFTTRWLCSDLEWCMDPLDIYFIRNSSTVVYTWSILYVRWANLPYPYVSGSSVNWTVYCWPAFSFTWFLLTGNITTWAWWYFGYDWWKILNFSWWSVVLSWNEITITPF